MAVISEQMYRNNMELIEFIVPDDVEEIEIVNAEYFKK
jgi:hypothetical protein